MITFQRSAVAMMPDSTGGEIDSGLHMQVGPFVFFPARAPTTAAGKSRPVGRKYANMTDSQTLIDKVVWSYG